MNCEWCDSTTDVGYEVFEGRYDGIRFAGKSANVCYECYAKWIDGLAEKVAQSREVSAA